MAEAGREVASHRCRWIYYSGMPENEVTYLKAEFDHLYREGDREPKMTSVGLHSRLTGRPARADALVRFMDYVQRHDAVWVCRGARDNAALDAGSSSGAGDGWGVIILAENSALPRVDVGSAPGASNSPSG